MKTQKVWQKFYLTIKKLSAYTANFHNKVYNETVEREVPRNNYTDDDQNSLRTIF